MKSEVNDARLPLYEANSVDGLSVDGRENWGNGMPNIGNGGDRGDLGGSRRPVMIAASSVFATVVTAAPHS